MTPTFEKIGQQPEIQVVERYFQTFNQGDFLETAHLFAATGQLLPPFEEPIVGQADIHAYLESEAAGMQISLKEFTLQQKNDGYVQVIVKGNVKALVFAVNAAWIFDLDAQGKIQQVEVKLLASLQDLLTLRPT